MLREFQEALQPENGLEDVLVGKLASLAWRHRRLLWAEGAEIRQASEFVEWDKQEAARKELIPAHIKIDLDFLQNPGYPALIYEISIPHVLDRCLRLLKNLRENIESEGFNEKSNTAILKVIYPLAKDGPETLFQTYLAYAHTASVSEEERQRRGYATPEECKKRILSEILQESRRLLDYQRKRDSIELERTRLEILRHNVPEPGRLDRLLRCEASLERSFDRTLSQLERLQRQRLGQPVTPRLDVNISNN